MMKHISLMFPENLHEKCEGDFPAIFGDRSQMISGFSRSLAVLLSRSGCDWSLEFFVVSEVSGGF